MFEGFDVLERLFQFALRSDDANLGLHHVSHLVVDQARVLSALSQQGGHHVVDGSSNLCLVDGGLSEVFCSLGRVLTCSLPKHDEVGERVPAQAVCTVKP